VVLDTIVAELPFEWDREPWLVDPEVLRSGDAFHHRVTGTMVARSMVRGGWSDGAITVLHGCLADVLPGRHSSRVTNYGEVRVAVYLGVSPSFDATADDLPWLEHVHDVDAALACSAWALDRGVAALPGGRPRGIGEPPGLPVPGEDVLHRFRLADEALGDKWVPPGFPHLRGMGNTWTVLRETTSFDVRDRLYPW